MAGYMQTETEINKLIRDTASSDMETRYRAERKLLADEDCAISSIAKMLRDEDYHVRLEAVKVLRMMRSPKAIENLIITLPDEHFDIRWAAAKGLIGVGMDVLEPMARALALRSYSRLLHQGARHVLTEVCKHNQTECVTRLINAFESYAPSVEVPVAAALVIEDLRINRPRVKMRRYVR